MTQKTVLPSPPPAWEKLPFFSERWPDVRDKLAIEKGWLPGPKYLFAAFEAIAPKDVRVIILGQDPYPTPGHANGLAFSVRPDIILPRSLRNIFKEMDNDIGGHPKNGDLSHWARQGVLLLNTALSVPQGEAGGHRNLGWQALPRQVVTEVQRHGPVAFVLWGRPASAAVGDLVRDQDLAVISSHPSPLAAQRGFFGSRPFSRVNAWLEENRGSEIDWIGDDQ